MDSLHKLQQQLKAPKGQYNSFGNYNYRSCEDILEAVKPLLLIGAILTISDELVHVGDRYYIKATATYTYKGESVSCSAYARESESKKGMDASQITGSASSYARKYALNGLLLIDDTKDADTRDNREETKPKDKTTPKQKKSNPAPLSELYESKGMTAEDQNQFEEWACSAKHVDDFEKIKESVAMNFERAYESWNKHKITMSKPPEERGDEDIPV